MPFGTLRIAKRCTQYKMKLNSLLLALAILGIIGCESSSSPEVQSKFENGEIENEINWINKSDSTYLLNKYDEDGTLVFTTTYVSGEKVKVKAVYPNGAIRGLSMYENELRVYSAEYFENGQRMGLVPQRLNGRIDGQVTYFYEDGSVRGTGFYSNGTVDSIWRDFDEQGTITLERIFKKGKRIN
jgi:antitoxin component YwqK of YwqJK toxin-antitoxin module